MDYAVIETNVSRRPIQLSVQLPIFLCPSTSGSVEISSRRNFKPWKFQAEGISNFKTLVNPDTKYLILRNATFIEMCWVSFKVTKFQWVPFSRAWDFNATPMFIDGSATFIEYRWNNGLADEICERWRAMYAYLHDLHAMRAGSSRAPRRSRPTLTSPRRKTLSRRYLVGCR